LISNPFPTNSMIIGTSDMALLEVRDLTVRFGGLKAINDVSFDVEEGQFVGLIGPNGAGKTTFMDAITGLVPSSGNVFFDGRELNGLPAHRRIQAGLGRTFQSLELFEDLTVRENLTAAAERSHWWSPMMDLVRPKPTASATKAVEHALSVLQIERLASRVPPSLSLGERKIVTIARALAASPRLLLLDEPAAGLDSEEGRSLGQELREIVREGVTIIMIDHDMALVLGVCEEIKVLDFGRLIAQGPAESIRADERVIHAYLGVDESTSARGMGEAVTH
jgi:ABC-type branched-subunit amino acid transport system ATPase component